jgi:hypothetical protein
MPFYGPLQTRYFGMKVIVRRREFRKTCFAEKYKGVIV